MKVLHVIPSVGPLRGGPSEVMRAMAQDLARAGFTVHVTTTDDNGPERLNVSYREAVVEEGVTYRFFSRQTRFYTFSWPLTRWLAEHVRDYDLLHLHSLFSYAALPAAFWAKRYRVPYIVRPLGVLNRWGVRNRRPWLKKLSLSLIERRILAGAAAIHFTSEQEWVEAAELGIGTKSVIIPNAADIPWHWTRLPRGQFRARYPQLSDRSIVLFLSRLDGKKGLDILLPAFAKIRQQFPHATLVIAGSGDAAFISQMQQRAQQLEIASDIVWTGFLAGEDKRAALLDADIFALPSYSESFGVAVVEAMACGVPVIVSDQVAIHREIVEDRAGLAVPCATEELAQALTVMLADAKLRKEMGTNGCHLARTKFSPEVALGRLVALYRNIADPASIAIDPVVTQVSVL